MHTSNHMIKTRTSIANYQHVNKSVSKFQTSTQNLYKYIAVNTFKAYYTTSTGTPKNILLENQSTETSEQATLNSVKPAEMQMEMEMF